MSKRFVHKDIDLGYEELGTEEDGNSRHYLVPNGKRYPSITTCLSILSRDGISEWRDKVGAAEADKIADRAAKRGTRIHTMCERHLNGDLDMKDFSLADHEMFNSLKPVIDQNIDNIYLQEKPLYSDYLGVAGKPDCIAEWNGKLSVIDFKTSNNKKEEGWIWGYFMQTAAYCVMFEERTKIPVDQIVVLIAVQGGLPAQVFVKRRDDYIEDTIQVIKEYKDGM